MTEATHVHDNSITSTSLRSEAAAELPLLSCGEAKSGAGGLTRTARGAHSPHSGGGAEGPDWSWGGGGE